MTRAIGGPLHDTDITGQRDTVIYEQPARDVAWRDDPDPSPTFRMLRTTYRRRDFGMVGPHPCVVGLKVAKRWTVYAADGPTDDMLAAAITATPADASELRADPDGRNVMQFLRWPDVR